MHGEINRSEAYIARLREFIAQDYGISIISFAPANRGYYGET
jgi:hypothetical protein